MTLSSTQKAVLVFLVLALLVSLTVAAWGVAKWGFARSTASEPTRGITVTDSAEVKVQPDTALITFGVLSEGQTASAATRANAATSTAVTAAIEKTGIPKSDIKTIDYYLEPEMNWKKSPPAVVAYSAINTVSVRTKDMGKIGALIDAAIAAGANGVRGARFDVEDKRLLRQKALTLAVSRAEGKAQAIAKAVGARLGPAVSVSESVDEYSDDNRSGPLGMDSQQGSGSPTPISPGETVVSAHVKVVYSVR